MPKPKRSLYFIVLPQVHLLDLAGPAQIFGHDLMSESVELHYVSTDSQVLSHQGLSLAQLKPLPQDIPKGSWLLIIGTHKARQHLAADYYQTAQQWLIAVEAQFELIIGICSGSLLLADTGLLNHKHCTTHHELLEPLKQLAPQAKVQENCIFVRDGKYWTSAGITTGIDLSLQLIADYWGHQRALAIARDLVVFQRRLAEHAQLGFWLQYRDHLHARIHQIQDQVMANPGHTWRVSALANSVHLSERQLRRLFQTATGCTLQAWIQQVRLEFSRQLLEQTHLTLPEIAERCGFESERSLRRLWQNWQGQLPKRA